MSEAVLRARYSSYVPDPRRRKMIQLPKMPKDIEMSSEYMVMRVYQSKHVSVDHDKNTRAQDIPNGNGWLWVVAGSIIAAIIVLGIVIGYLEPGPFTGVILPIGLGLWWLLYKLSDSINRTG